MNWILFLAFGKNSYGDIGQGSISLSAVPLKIQNLIDVKSVQCGYENTYILLKNGTAFATGFNQNGQLGVGNSVHQKVPMMVPLVGVTKISASIYNALFLTSTGDVYCR